MSNYIVSVKGFGDALIALWSMNAMLDVDKFRLISNKYISPLIDHLGKSSVVEILPDSDNYPEHYNLRRSNPFHALDSLLSFKKKLEMLDNAKHSIFIFDLDGWRERLCLPNGAGHFSVSNMHEKNIYLAYLALLSKISGQSLIIRRSEQASRLAQCDLPIFFSSRVKAKELKINDLLLLNEFATNHGLRPRFICHACDDVGLISKSGLQWESYNSYKDLDKILSSALAVISSDSFPAHYAEYFGHKIFVIKNIENSYYLPYSAFISNHWSIGFSPSQLNLFLSK
jgi:hypothetical protein